MHQKYTMTTTRRTSNQLLLHQLQVLFYLAIILLSSAVTPPVQGDERSLSSCGEFFGDFAQARRTPTHERQQIGLREVNDTVQHRVVTVKLAVLMPNHPEAGEAECDNCFVMVLPVIELAIGRAEEMLNEFLDEFEGENRTTIHFRRIHGDTKCSSTIGPLIAVEMVTKSRPGRMRKRGRTES